MRVRALLFSLLLREVLRHEEEPLKKGAVSMVAESLNLTNATGSRTLAVGTVEEEGSELTRDRGEAFMPHAMRRRYASKGAERSVRGLPTKKSMGLAIDSVVRRDVLSAASSATHFLLKLVTGDGWLSFWQVLLSLYSVFAA